MYAWTASKIRGRHSQKTSFSCRRPLSIYALIRKAVGVGEIDRGPGDQASVVIKPGRLVEVVLGLNTNGV